MATQAQIDACGANGKKSRGPVTPEGLRKASMNALKHGRRSKKSALLRDDSFAFETRRQKWMANADPKTDMEEYMVARTVSLSFELDRADRAHIQRLTSAIEDSDDAEIMAVEALGKRLAKASLKTSSATWARRSSTSFGRPCGSGGPT